jgi:Domain of unknown function (DUF4337)
MANTHEHLEHAEHDQHFASDPFNQRVAVSMAIVAAILAGLSMIGHRTHNKVLQLLNEANRYSTEAGRAEVEKSNLFAWYQSKRQRQDQYRISAVMLKLAYGGNETAREKFATDWRDKADAYDTSNDKKDNLPDLLEQGTEAGKRADELKAKAKATRDEAEHVHHQANRFDIAHLAAELGLVLCSIALLTRKRGFWYAGIAAAALAIAVGGSAYLISHEPATLDAKDGHGP